MNIVLIGNPNVGKTTLFNILTGSSERVGNYAGVTIDRAEGFFNDNKIIDLPGIYALDAFSHEELVARDFLENGDVDMIINIVDASNLSRNLYLTMQLKKYNKPIILVLNMMDVVEDSGYHIDYDYLSDALGVHVITMIATKNKGLDSLENIIRDMSTTESSLSQNISFNDENEAYKYIDDILSHCLTKNNIKKNTVSHVIDTIVLNKFLAYPIFLLIIFIIFKLTFSLVGTPLSDMLGVLLTKELPNLILSLAPNSSEWFKSLIIDGIIGGVGSILSFLPIILVLFLCISFLEDSGYMARGAFIMDNFMRKIGLSGKAFIPMMMGFGCSVPAIMSARTLETEKDRKMTAFLVPFLSCNARLQVYVLFAAAFFKQNKGLIVAVMYLVGVFVVIVFGLIFKNTIFKHDDEPFLIEIPKYKLPNLKELCKHTLEKAIYFVRKVGTIIFSVSVIIWFLSRFNTGGFCDIDSSFLSQIGNFISIIFKPLGFANWQASVALIAGLMAKEIIVSTMGSIYGTNLLNILPLYYTKLAALSFIIFVALYTPCISVIATIKKEFGSKIMVEVAFFQLGVAYVFSFLVYNIGLLVLKLF